MKPLHTPRARECTPTPFWGQRIVLHVITRAISSIMTKIRSEQMGHKALLQRGRSHKRLQYAFLFVAAAAAGIAGSAAVTMTL